MTRPSSRYQLSPANTAHTRADIQVCFDRMYSQRSVFQRMAMFYLAIHPGPHGWREIEDHYGWRPGTIKNSFGGTGSVHAQHHAGQILKGPCIIWRDSADSSYWAFEMLDAQARIWLTLIMERQVDLDVAA